MAEGKSDIRTTRPGRKRLLITITTLISFVFGTPFWYKSTQVYRAPLPFDDIDSFASWVLRNPIEQRCHLNVILALGLDHGFNKAKLDLFSAGIEYNIQKSLWESSFEKQTCQAGFELLVTLDTPNLCLRSGNEDGSIAWPCGLGTPSILQTIQLSDEDDVDEILWKYSNAFFNSLGVNSTDSRSGYQGGFYTIVVFQKEDLGELGSCKASNGDKISGCNSKETKDLTLVHAANDAAHWQTVIGKYRHGWMTGQRVSLVDDTQVAIRIGDVAVNFFGGSKIGSAEDKVSTLPLSADGGAILSFSLLNAEPSDWIFDWDFEALEECFLLPVVEALKDIAQLKIESQVLYYTPKAVQSQWVPALHSHIVTAKQLPFFVNANEWHLDSSSAAAGRSKILHFAIYVPAADEWPLQFQTADGRVSPSNSFTSPGWGGVSVWNPSNLKSAFRGDKSQVTVLGSDDFELLAKVFVAQLRTLFGFTPSTLEDSSRHVFSLPASRTGFADWELDVLLRRRISADVAGTASTLTSLSRLVRKLPNMLIMDEIGNQVKISLSAAIGARASAAQGLYCATAELARTARSLAEEAFFHPSIMSLLYNPTEHHLAIYTPFFVPVLLHAILAVVKEVSHYRGEWKRFKQKHQ